MRDLAVLLVVWGVSISAVDAGDTGERTLRYAPAPVDNPLKGLVPYAGDRAHLFPHSMEFCYLPLSALVTGKSKYNWGPLEKRLDEISGRGHQVVFRIYVEYPGKKDGIPKYLINQGLKIHRYKSKRDNLTPDYANQDLRNCLKNFIAQLGKKYDGDRRIGFITAGLLGMWGEWHNYPRTDLWAPKQTQTEVIEAYEAAFKVTPILLRYPAGDKHYAQAPNAKRRFGYHDDSFAWATTHTGKKRDGWFFLTAMNRAGPDAIEKWKTYPIGGEIRPEAWGKVFDEAPGDARIQNFEDCVKKTHVTWLMDSGLFQKKTWTKSRRQRAQEQVRKMGYVFHASTVRWARKKDSLRVWVQVENRGVAPFYYDWPVRFGWLTNKGSVVRTFAGTSKLIGLLPGAKPRVWDEKLNLAGIRPGDYHLALQVANPLPKGQPLRFANTSQGQHLSGWLTLAKIEWR